MGLKLLESKPSENINREPNFISYAVAKTTQPEKS